VTAARLVELCLQKGLTIDFSLERRDCLGPGLQRIAQGNIDLVLLDLNLPDSSGLETFRRARENSSNVPIVILSGQGEESLSVTAVRQGAQDYLVKGRFDEESLARSVRFAVERSRRQRAEKSLQLSEEQLFVARSVQQELFPNRPPESPVIDLWGKCEPAEKVGGDYFDYIPLLNGRLGVVIADISGHGIRAAFTMVALRAVIRSLVMMYQDIGHIVSMTQRVTWEDFRVGEFVTLMLIQVDSSTRSLTYVSAGHEGYLFNRRGEIKHVLKSSSLPVGVVENLAYMVSPAVTFEQGDLLVLCTDGVTETQAPDGSLFGAARLFDVIRSHSDMSPRQITEMVFHSVSEHARGQRQLDDVTVVVGRFR
jgi:serine phosphatase RsbU (regulator of sigma subunit)